MKTKLTVLVDNKPYEDLKGEWGLSIYGEFQGKNILIDAGSSPLFAENMKKIGLSIEDVDYATLSHAHFDHANGIPKFFKENTKAKFFLRETTSDNVYHKHFIFHKYIGIPKKLLEQYPDRIEIVSGDYKLMDGAYLIPHKTPGLDAVGKREHMYRRENHKWIPDDFSHEQSLVLETEKGLVIINCCSHGGAANIIREVSDTFPGKKVYGIIGGFHLYNKKEEEIRALSKAIEETGIEFVCTGHCTGNNAYSIMKKELGEKLIQLYCGLKMEF